MYRSPRRLSWIDEESLFKCLSWISPAPSVFIAAMHLSENLYFYPGMGSNGVTVKRFLQLLMILELYLELSYFLSQILLVVTAAEVTEVPKFLI